jgi:hypothetical protein
MGLGGTRRPAATPLSDQADRRKETDKEHKLLHRKASKTQVFGRQYLTLGILSTLYFDGPVEDLRVRPKPDTTDEVINRRVRPGDPPERMR